MAMIDENSVHLQISVWEYPQCNSSQTKNPFNGSETNSASFTRSSHTKVHDFHVKNNRRRGLLHGTRQCCKGISGFLEGLIPGLLLCCVVFAVVLTLYLTSNQETTKLTTTTSTKSMTNSTTTTITISTTTTTTISTTTTTTISTTTTTTISTSTITSTTKTSTSAATSLGCSSTGLGTITSRPSDNISPWNSYSFNYTVTFSATFIQFAIQTGSLRWYYLDDVSVVDMTVASNELLNNPNFENSTTELTGWDVLCNSTCTVGNNTGARLVSGANCHLATGNCFSVNCYGSGQINFLRQYLTFTVGHTYRISYYLTGVGGSPNPNQQFYLDIM